MPDEPAAGSLDIGVGTVAGALPGADATLDLGPSHPTMHGAMRLRVTLDGDRIATAEPQVGYVHRGAEKLFEQRDYRAILMLADRHDWLSSFASELGVVLTVERMLGIEVPQRAVWLRTLLAELTRVTHHLAFLATFPLEVAAADIAFVAAAEREALLAVVEELTGSRLHTMTNRVGGLAVDVPAGWRDRCRAAVADLRDRLPQVAALLSLPAFVERTVGVGVLAAADVLAYGVSGPAARASGVPLDLRVDEPYLAYAELEVPVVTRTTGDAHGRFEVLVEQVGVSCDLVDTCLDRLPAGPVDQRLPKNLTVPEGSTYAWTESPPGINGYWLVSRGGRTPWRLKVRSASFNTVQALERILPGTRVEDLVAILGSLFVVIGDIDR